jgi:hypothetical protein
MEDIQGPPTPPPAPSKGKGKRKASAPLPPPPPSPKATRPKRKRRTSARPGPEDAGPSHLPTSSDEDADGSANEEPPPKKPNPARGPSCRPNLRPRAAPTAVAPRAPPRPRPEVVITERPPKIAHRRLARPASPAGTEATLPPPPPDFATLQRTVDELLETVQSNTLRFQAIEARMASLSPLPVLPLSTAARK